VVVGGRFANGARKKTPCHPTTRDRLQSASAHSQSAPRSSTQFAPMSRHHTLASFRHSAWPYRLRSVGWPNAPARWNNWPRRYMRCWTSRTSSMMSACCPTSADQRMGGADRARLQSRPFSPPSSTTFARTQHAISAGGTCTTPTFSHAPEATWASSFTRMSIQKSSLRHAACTRLAQRRPAAPRIHAWERASVCSLPPLRSVTSYGSAPATRSRCCCRRTPPSQPLRCSHRTRR
jgi:hypothetical protein